MNTTPRSIDDSRPDTKDVLKEIAFRIATLEGVLKLLTESRHVSERYDPIPPFK